MTVLILSYARHVTICRPLLSRAYIAAQKISLQTKECIVL